MNHPVIEFIAACHAAEGQPEVTLSGDLANRLRDYLLAQEELGKITLDVVASAEAVIAKPSAERLARLKAVVVTWHEEAES